MNKWTIKKLNETDDITFAMCILSERQASLNPNAPLAQKLQNARLLLDKVRGGCPITSDVISDAGDIYSAVCNRIHLEEERKCTIADITGRLNEYDTLSIDLHGFEPAEVLTDKQMMACIMERLFKCSCENDYWECVDMSIERGIAEALDLRKEGNSPQENGGADNG